MIKLFHLFCVIFVFLTFLDAQNKHQYSKDRPYALVLGIAQDGGYPHAGCEKKCCKDAWKNDSLRKKVSSIAIIDPRSGLAWMIDATPDFAAQYNIITKDHGVRLAGIFLTHAHIGHYTGLMHLGREVMGAKNIVVYAMPRMKHYLEKNGPWSQLVKLKNIRISLLKDKKEVQLTRDIIVEPFTVPHRDEFSETVGYNIMGPNESLIYIPDIDKWKEWGHDIRYWVESNSYALLDGTFYNDGEVPNRSIDEIPHPFIVESIYYFESMLKRNQKKIYFIHLNHTNPAINKNSSVSKQIINYGFNTAREGMKFFF